MNKQYMKSVQNKKKAYLTSVGYIAVWLSRSLSATETTFLLFQEQEGFWNCHVTPYEDLNGYSNPLGGQ